MRARTHTHTQTHAHAHARTHARTYSRKNTFRQIRTHTNTHLVYSGVVGPDALYAGAVVVNVADALLHCALREEGRSALLQHYSSLVAALLQLAAPRVGEREHCILNIRVHCHTDTDTDTQAHRDTHRHRRRHRHIRIHGHRDRDRDRDRQTHQHHVGRRRLPGAVLAVLDRLSRRFRHLDRLHMFSRYRLYVCL